MQTKSNLKFTLLLVFILILPALVNAQHISSKFDEYLNSYYDMEPFSGVVLIAKGDSILLNKGYGMANYELNVPNTHKTVFNIASLTKPFTAVLALQLVQKGKLNLKGKVIDYISDYPKKNGSMITIHNLLNHTSGIPHYEVFPDFYFKQSREEYAPKEFIKLFWNQNLLFKPGTNFKYTSLGYYVLTYIIQQITGKPYKDLIKDNICIPAGLKNTQVDDDNIIVKNRASGYEYDYTGLINADYRDMSSALGSGDLLSTTEDLLLFMKAIEGTKLLNPKYKEMIFTPYPPGTCYGWFEDKVKNPKDNSMLNRIYHTGGVNGFRTILSKYDNGLCIIVLSNFGFTQREKIEHDLFTIYCTGVFPPEKQRKPVRISPEMYKSFAGNYSASSSVMFKINIVENGLTLDLSNSYRTKLIPASENKFYLLGKNGEIIFKKNKKEQVTELDYKEDDVLKYKAVKK
ncbi:MAG: serine hydrolase domain-containing protein [FCB group bacterium]